MKIVSILCFTFFSLFGFSQDSNIEKYTPYTIQYQLTTENLPVLRYTAPDLAELFAQDAVKDAQKGRMRIGVVVPILQNFLADAQKTTLANGYDVYRMKIATQSAEALSFLFDEFELRQHDQLFIFNEKGSEVFRFTDFDNQDNFATGLIGGETIIIELATKLTSPTAVISLNEIGYTYRNSGKSAKRGFGDSDACEINVNCSEGNNWQNQKNATVRILVKEGSSQFWCSGVLINNVRQDCTPYLLTAEHCGIQSTPSDINQWVFYFNYDAPNCVNPPSEGSLANNLSVGATLKARSNDNGGDTGPDFMLLELNNVPTANFNAYYAGWDANNTGATSGVSIHHPSGDIKKISTYTNTLTSTSFGGIAINTHWSVNWVATANGHGVTETGSSGSPIFNQNQRVVGTLTGGSAFCSNPNNPDEYGKMSYHWLNNGLLADNQLKPWLDPDNTGALVLDGIAAPCNTSTNNLPKSLDVKVFPNPAENHIQIEWKSPFNYADVRIINSIGQEVGFYKNIQNQENIPLNQFANGLYWVEIKLDEQKVVKKLILAK